MSDDDRQPLLAPRPSEYYRELEHSPREHELERLEATDGLDDEQRAELEVLQTARREAELKAEIKELTVRTDAFRGALGFGPEREIVVSSENRFMVGLRLAVLEQLERENRLEVTDRAELHTLRAALKAVGDRFDAARRAHGLPNSSDVDRGLHLVEREEAAAPAVVESVDSVARDRRVRVDAYIAEVEQATGKRLTRTDIWKLARYKSRTEFERWERNDPKATKTAAERFEKILSKKPHLE
jgi:hypothetical protein